MEDDIDSNEEEDGKESKSEDSAPVPNTLETTLAIFPLAETRLFRTSVKRNHQFISPFVKEDVIKSVLFPSAEDVFGDTFNRIAVSDASEPVKKTKTNIGKALLHEKLTAFLKPSKVYEKDFKTKLKTTLPSAEGEQAAKPPRAVQKFKSGLRVLKKVVQAGKLSDVLCEVAVPPKEYSYMMPNEFNARMVTPYALFDYQKSCVQWMVDREERIVKHDLFEGNTGGCLLAMVMGLGKTPTAATLIARTIMAQRNARSCSMYVCPKNLLGTVRYEFEKFFGNQFKIMIYHNDFLKSAYFNFDEQEIRKYDVIITNYSTLSSRINAAKILDRKGKLPSESGGGDGDPVAKSFCNFDWYRIILDESHEIRERNTVRFKSLMTLKSRRKICMSGTPIHNRMNDIYSQLEFCGLRLPKGTKMTKDNLKDLGLTNFIRFVENKDAQAVTLPPKEIHKIYFGLSQEEQVLHNFYTNAARQVFEKSQVETGREKSKRTIEAHVCMVRVLQVCSAPFLITAASKTEFVPTDEDMIPDVPVTHFPIDPEINKWVQNRDGTAGLRSSKMRAFVEFMGKLRSNATETHPMKVVVFANLTSTLRLAIASMTLENPEYDTKHAFVHGGISSSQKREESFTKFRTRADVEALYMTLKVGSIGLNLTEADTVIFLEPWYSYSTLAQGECRVHRIGQMRPVNIYYFLAKDSAEERVYRIAQTKKELAEDVAKCKQDAKLASSDMQFILMDVE